MNIFLGELLLVWFNGAILKGLLLSFRMTFGISSGSAFYLSNL